MNKIKLAVIFGSSSKSYDISCISAANILNVIDTNKYEISKIGIDKDNNWYEYNGDIKNIKENTWLNDENNKKEIVDLINTLRGFDIVFPVIQGNPAENGTIHGLLDMYGIKYTGSPIISSSICSDKVYCKMMASLYNIPVVPYYYIYSMEELYDLIKELCYPLIIKPSKGSSSHGIAVVHDKDELVEAVKNAFTYDNKVLIENYIENKKDLTCSAIGNKDIYISTLGEFKAISEFYNINLEYKNSKNKIIIPADTDTYVEHEIKEYATKLYKALDLKGFSSIDFIYDTDNSDLYFNEINTIPEFTDIGMFAKLLEHDGVAYDKIIDRIITLGLEN